MLNIEVQLTLKSPLHIGAAGPAGTTAVRGLVKDQDGWPYIPASAFKGRLRHSVERLARSLDRSTCDTHKQTCQDPTTACPVCRVFGSPWIPGAIRFMDLQLSAPEALVQLRQSGQRLRTVYRYGVGLTRTRKVAADQLLYTTELFEPGTPLTFSGTLSGDLTIEQSAWVIAGLRLMESLGGNRSRGLGWLRVSAVVRDDSDGQEIPPEHLLQALERSV